MGKKHKIFDSHFHIIDKKFPLAANHNFIPGEFTIDDYLNSVKDYNLQGGAVIAGSFQAYDQTFLMDSLNRLGSNFVGVTQVHNSITDDELVRLHEAGIRAVRFNIKRMGMNLLDGMENLAVRVYELLGWHVELYVDSDQLQYINLLLAGLPRLSIDHLGLVKKGLDKLLLLAEKGVKVKATGFGRVDFDVQGALREIYSANPESLMFGTDLPSTRSPRKYSYSDYELILKIFDDDALDKILFKNAAEFYRINIS